MKSPFLKCRLAVLFLLGVGRALTACTTTGRANRGLDTPSYRDSTATPTAILTATLGYADNRFDVKQRQAQPKDGPWHD